MNSLLMREVLDHGVDRKDFCDLVGLEVYVPTDEMYDLTEQSYTYSSTLYDIYGASDQFEKKADSFFKVRFIIYNVQLAFFMSSCFFCRVRSYLL